MTAGMFHEMLHSPVFVIPESLGYMTETEVEWFMQHCAHNEAGVPESLPYVSYVLCLPASNLVMAVTSRQADRLVDTRGMVRTKMTTWSGWLNGKEDTVAVAAYTGEIKGGAIGWAYKSGQEVTDYENYPAAKEHILHPLSVVIRFVFHVASSASMVVKVSPAPRAGKSTEWHMARTHHLLLHRAQVRRMMQTRNGVSAAVVQRAAHWRRAHLRRLNSPLFKHRQGQIITVKQAWVGPKEWVGLDGKVYMVVE